MRKLWKLKELKNKDLPTLPEYASLIVRLLALRGLTDPEDISDFLNPDYAKLHDPFLFKDMEKAVERIRVATEAKEKITVYADYDADAITAAAVVFLALKKMNALVDCYIPDRFSEGYGINADAIRLIANKGSKLIVTVDCGTNAVEELACANQLGVDVIVTDHHEITGALPNAYALINPKNPHDAYPFPYLTGVGVAYKLIQGLYSKITDYGLQITPGFEKWLLDLVAIGTVADCQSLIDENRILVSYGLKVLAKTRWLGLKKLITAAGLEGKSLDTYALGFILAPRINAAGRIKHADLAFRLLVTEDETEADGLAKELNDLNQQRQILTEQVLSEARSQLELISDKKVLLAYGEDWPKGVVGLVAGKLVEEYGRPVLVLRKEELLATGSGRSVGNFDLVAALNSSKDFLVRYGGHTQAAGFTLASTNILSFHQKLLEYVETLSVQFEPPVLEVDSKLSELDISFENFEYIKRMAPFGVGNPKPKFVSYGFEIFESRTVGNGNKHLKMKLRFPASPSTASRGGGDKIFNAIAFGQGFLANQLSHGAKIDAVYELDENAWNGNKQLELKIIDLKINE